MFSLAAMIYAGASAADRAGSNPNEQSRSGLFRTTEAPSLTRSVLNDRMSGEVGQIVAVVENEAALKALRPLLLT